MCNDYSGRRTGPRSRPGPRSAADRSGCLECTGRGHQDAFEDVYDATVAQVWHLARLKARGDAAYAEQVVRETYAEVWRSASSFRPDEHRPLTWVLAVASAVTRPGPRRDPAPSDGRVA